MEWTQFWTILFQVVIAVFVTAFPVAFWVYLVSSATQSLPKGSETPTERVEGVTAEAVRKGVIR